MPVAGIPLPIQGVFRDTSGALVDYTTVKFSYSVNVASALSPTLAWPVDLTYSGGSGYGVVTKTSTGVYLVTLLTTGLQGVWEYGWQGIDSQGVIQAEWVSYVVVDSSPSPALF